MAEPRRRISATGRPFSFAVAFVVLTCAAAFASVAAAASPSVSSLPIPNSFRLQATNGYTLYVVGAQSRKGSQASMLVIAAAKGREVTYQAPATVTETSMRASLGEVGQISVAFERSGKATSAPCGKRKVRFDSGSWVGTIDFRGEEGYADAEATSVPGNIDYFLSGICGGVTGGSSGPRKGADLEVRNPGLGPRLNVYKHRPGAAALITARVTEYIDGISIERVSSQWMPGSDFAYDSHLRTADVTPPGPFSGSARFAAGKKAGERWQGDLTVDMPGRSDVPLTGPLLRATLSPSE